MRSADELNSLMSQYVDKIVHANGDVVPAVAARELSRELLRTDPELLTGWLDNNADVFIAEAISKALRSARARARAQARPRAFKKATEEFEKTGDSSVFSVFDVRLCIDDNNTQRRIGDMTGNDHMFVANRHYTDSRRAKLLGDFHRSLADRLGDQRVSDVYTEEQFADMYRSITGTSL